jgi:hypothetical protein
MSDDRLPADVWVHAQLRRWNSEGFPAVLLRRGDAHGGAIILKIVAADETCRILTQTRDSDGNPAWMQALQGQAANPADAEAYVGRALQRDPDLWVIEIEDRRGLWSLDGKVLK